MLLSVHHVPSLRPFPCRHHQIILLESFAPRRFLLRGGDQFLLFIPVHHQQTQFFLSSTRLHRFSSSHPFIQSNPNDHARSHFLDADGLRRIHPRPSSLFVATFVLSPSRVVPISLCFRWASIRVANREWIDESKVNKGVAPDERAAKEAMERTSTSTLVFEGGEEGETTSKVPTSITRRGTNGRGRCFSGEVSTRTCCVTQWKVRD